MIMLIYGQQQLNQVNISQYIEPRTDIVCALWLGDP